MLKVPAYVVKFCSYLSKGGRCLLVGGAVRDHILNIPVHDYDFIFMGNAEWLKKRFSSYTPSDNFVETLVVLWRGHEFEINVVKNSLEDNLSRRDFTIDAIAYDPFEGKFIDPLNGRRDIELKIIRASVDAEKRLREDPVRIIRGIRLCTRLSFSIEPETYRMMKWLSYLLGNVNPYRFKKEIEELLKLKTPSSAFLDLLNIRALHYFLPELAACEGIKQNQFHRYDLFTHIMKVVDAVPQRKTDVRFAALLHDIGKPATRFWKISRKDYVFYEHEKLSAEMAENLLRRIGISRERRKKIITLIRNHMFSYHTRWSDKAVRKFISRVGKENIDDLFILRKADRIGTGKKKSMDDLKELYMRIKREIESGTPLSVNDLDISGYDLMDLGLKGVEIGRAKRFLLERVLESPEINRKDELLKIVKENIHLFKSKE